MTPPAGVTVRGIVDFFGPTLTVPLPNHWSALPPVLIFHGTDDHLVSITESEYAVNQLAACAKVSGRDSVFTPVRGQGHGFKDPELTQARTGTVAFLTRTLIATGDRQWRRTLTRC